MPLNGGRSVGKGSRKPHSHLWEELPDGVLPGVPEDDRQAYGSQAEADSAEAARAPAREDEGHDRVAPTGGSRIFPVPCGPAQRGPTEGVSARSATHVVVAASPAESTNPLDMGAISGETRAPDSGSRDPASVSGGTLCVQTSKVRTVCVSPALARLSHFAGFIGAKPFRISEGYPKVFTTEKADRRPILA